MAKELAKEPSTGEITVSGKETDMKAILKMAKNMAKEPYTGRSATDMKAIGKMAKNMAKAYTTGQTAPVQLRNIEKAR
jgi:hypothetical protein